jgi:hypothetical protein
MPDSAEDYVAAQLACGEQAEQDSGVRCAGDGRGECTDRRRQHCQLHDDGARRRRPAARRVRGHRQRRRQQSRGRAT